MITTRRSLIAGTGAALATPLFASMPAFANTGSRTYSVSRGGRELGVQSISVQRSGDETIVDLEARINGTILVVKIDYLLKSREVWKGQVLQSIDSTTTQNDESFFVKARRTDGGLDVKSTKFNGLVEGNPGTSTIFVPDIMDRRIWVSTQSGRPLKVAVENRGRVAFKLGEQSIDATHYYCGGDLRFPIDAYFRDDGELIAFFIEAFGRKNQFVASELSQPLRPLWA